MLFLLLFALFPNSCLSVPPAPTLSHVPFDCRRIHPAFCCSNRVRQNCAQLCLGPSSPCIPPPFSSNQDPPFPPPLHQSQFPTSFGGSIDQSSLTLPNPNPDGPLPNLPQMILPPPLPDQNAGRRRFTTEGEWHGHSAQQANKPPPPPPSPPQSPFFPSGPPPPLLPSSPPFGLILPPPDAPTASGTPVPIEDLDQIQPEAQGNNPNGQTQVEAASSPDSDFFPTLMPPPEFGRSIDELPAGRELEGMGEKMEEEEEIGKVTKTEGGARDGTASARQNGKQRKGGGGALKPPHLMSELAELEGSLERADKNEWTAPVRLNLEAQEEEGENEKENVGGNEEEANSPQERTTVREGTLVEEGGKAQRTFANGGFAPIEPSQLWSFRVKPSGQGDGRIEANGPESRLDLPMPTNQTAENGGLFGEKIDVFVDKLFNKQFLHSIAAITNRNYTNKGNVGALPQIPQMPQSTSSPPPLQCGIPPEFAPCLPLDQANARLQNCCQKRQMPAGCLPLCRYDTSQAEVKMAFDKGQCGILNVTPFLECASQGQNNLECCRHRQIAKLSGTQCEAFCTGEKIGLLGLQHLVCSTQIQPILRCHHSGLKP